MLMIACTFSMLSNYTPFHSIQIGSDLHFAVFHCFPFLFGSRFSLESNQVQQIKKSSSASASSSHFKKATNMCGLRMAHDRWALNVKLAEARWAQQQARERELEEVIDFLQ